MATQSRQRGKTGKASKLSDDGLRLIAEFEGFRADLYDDAAGHCTIGYGHLVHRGNCDGSEPAEFKKGISKERGLELLRKDASAAAATVGKAVTVPLSQGQFDALVSFVFNVGGGAFADSTLLRLLNEGDYESVPEQLDRWVHANGKPLPGLVRRRKAEGELFAASAATKTAKRANKEKPAKDAATAPEAAGRDLELKKPLVEGADVKALQRALNGSSDRFPKILQFELDVDGKFGEQTLLAAAKTAHVMGLRRRTLDVIEREHVVTKEVQSLLLDPSQRNEEQKERAQERREALRKKAARRPSLGRVRVTGTAGDPHWGGAGDVMEDFVEPFLISRGLTAGSGKRTPAENKAVGGSSTSDHLTTRTTCAARDFPTFKGEDDARALAAALGFGSWRPDSFDGFEFSAGGKRFRAQILWGSAINHGDHIHVGVSVA